MKTDLPTKMNLEEKNALKKYCSSQFRDINLILREDIQSKSEFDVKYSSLYGEGITPDHLYQQFCSNINILDELFKRSKNTGELQVYRLLDITKLPISKLGDSYIDRGFVSTSLSEEGLKNVIHSDSSAYNTKVKIIIPPETPCIYIGEMFNREENELLLNRGLKYQLIDTDKDLLIFQII